MAMLNVSLGAMEDVFGFSGLARTFLAFQSLHDKPGIVQASY